jgi:hypothetical protein
MLKTTRSQGAESDYHAGKSISKIRQYENQKTINVKGKNGAG